MPSEPQIRRSGCGPAPLPGRRRVVIRPCGVTNSTLCTNSSMWVYSVAKWPPERVTIIPPRVASSKLCGKCLSVSPSGFSAASNSGPRAPASISAQRSCWSMARTRFMLDRSRLTTPG